MTRGSLGSGAGSAWTDEELDFIADHPDWTARRISEALGRTTRAVQKKRHKIDQGWTRNVTPWTTDEDRLMLEMGDRCTAAQLAEALPGRTPIAIYNRRRLLGLKVLEPNELKPQKLGARPLVAKTCTTCGLLLQAEWYRWRPKDRCWSSSCRRCMGNRTGQWFAENPAPRGERSASFVQRMQLLTHPLARRRGEPYTDADQRVLSDPELSLLQKAVRLERTYAGVATECALNGYRSHVGLGEPTDVWVIHNPNVREVAGMKLTEAERQAAMTALWSSTARGDCDGIPDPPTASASKESP
jgi:hypothetical protein